MHALPKFQPHPALRGGQLQTIGGYVLSRSRHLKADQILWVEVDDGDRLALEVNIPAHEKPRGLVILMHGLGGCSESPYILRIAAKFLSEGWLVVRFNHRGCGSHDTAAKKLYHSGSTADIWQAMQTVSSQWPDLTIIPIAFSLSGTMLLNLMGQDHRSCELVSQWKRSIIVCSPIDLEQSSRQLSSWRNLHYDRFFCRILLEHARRKYPQIYQEAVGSQQQAIRSLRRFDELITAPFSGFRDRADYYKRCSPRFTVSEIRKPTMILAAADDPIVHAPTVRYAPYSCEVELLMQSSGGHLGFMSADKTKHGDFRWMDQLLLDVCHDSISVS